MGRSKRSHNESHSLTVVVLDVSPAAWGQRDLQRSAQDKARAASGKRSVGPAVLEEVLEAVQAFGSAYSSLERDSGFIVLAVADGESAVVYPRKDQLSVWLQHPESYVADTRRIQNDLVAGVAELVARAARKTKDATNSQAAMASAFSKALCLINRFLVAAKTGVSALQTEHYMNRDDDEGVIALMGNTKKKAKQQLSAWSPRILIIQASDDRARDYNAFMNCAFAAIKHSIVVDGCFLTASGSKSSSAFLEQACDLTSGVFLAPSGAAQVGGALTEVFFSVFLSPLSCRSSLNLPALNKVDFRARCFQSGETVDRAFVCNQCLSIFSMKPSGNCPTCQAAIHTEKRRRESAS